MSVIPPWVFCEMATGCKPLSYEINFWRWLFGYASVMNLCSLVLSRYITVVKPFKYLTFMKRRRVIQMVSLSWAVPLTCGIAFYLNWFIFEKPRVLYSVSFLRMRFLELFPCFVLIVSFASILQVVCKHESAARTRARQLRFNHHHVLFKIQEKSAVKIMAVFIGLFLLCYGFYIRCSLVSIFKIGECNDKEYKIPLLVFNSAFNPVAYAFFKRDIKKEIKRRIVCVIRKA